MGLGDAFNDGLTGAKIHAVAELPGKGMWILQLKPQTPVPYRAGQYIDIAFGDLGPRSYSLAEAPSADGILTIHIKRGPGAVSDYVANKAQTGGDVRVSQAKGVNVYDPTDRRPLLAIAGGAGVTPIKAIIDEALRSGHAQPVWFFWGTKTADDQYCQSYFEELEQTHPDFHFVPVIGGNVGDVAAAAFNDLSSFKIHVCGPPPMISHAIGAALNNGARRDSIWHEGKQPEPGTPPLPEWKPS